ncbi:LacI family DNA-binding transcriptional regulator [Gryllotalpicola ginsengisoli]|uniref:LacI family DNA-binding transcriptional regulator n=1 Tax=Gryllotalpicola ginsengisoli TaxID=444608 RepID=UPI0003B7805F|nr:LacI family DNA-binding transcriptional regulator [Gryllotalpicola ginsengisoli]
MAGNSSRATIYTIAERAGVSISTVSLAINHPHRVSESTRKKIVEVARALGYRPDGAWRARTGGRPVGIAVAAPFTSYSSYSRRLTGILDRLRDTGIDVMVYDLESAQSAEAPLLDALPIRAGVDGIIVMGVPLSREGGAKLADWGPPVVLLDASDPQTPSVLVDDHEGGRLVARHLLELGHEKVAFVHDPQRSLDYVSAGMERAGGLIGAFESAGRPGGVVPVEAPTDAASDDALAASVLATGATAVFASHDELASRTLVALRRAGVRVPDELSLVGYDDGPLAAGLGLTTVRQPFEESGRAAAELLLGLMEGRGPRPNPGPLPVELVVRETTAAPRVGALERDAGRR